jgi:hypothetical protein
MTWFQEVFTPGRPLYWAMLCIPNGLVFLWAFAHTFRSRWFLLVCAAAMLNVLVPWMGQVVFIRNNGINAPGTPHWFDMLTAILWTNGQTICLLMLVPVLISFKTPHDRK